MTSLPRAVDLVAFDVDGTLVEHERSLVVWQLLNRRFGVVDEENASRFRDFMAGRITYADWVRLDVEGWRDGGARRATMVEAIAGDLRLVAGAAEVVHELHRRGYQLAVVSGTLDLVLDTLFPDHPFDHVFTNRIWFSGDGAIAGWEATPYDMDGKAEAVRLLSSRTSVPLSRMAFVGDNYNDCSALALVGCPIVYDVKDPRPRALARHDLPRGGLDGLLAILP